MRTLRIAVCFSGMARLLQETLFRHDIFFSWNCNEYTKKILLNYGYDSVQYDYFFYFSEIIIYSNSVDKQWFIDNNLTHKQKIDDELMSILKNNKKTKKVFIEYNFEKLKKLIKKVNPSNIADIEIDTYRRINQFYSAEQCNNLKIEYEIENQMTYDMCIRFRTDLYVFDYLLNNEDHKLHLITHFLQNKNNSFFFMGEGYSPDGTYSVGDLSSYSDSKCADLYYKNITESILMRSNLFFNNDKIYIPEEIWGFFLKENKLDYKPTQFGLELIKINHKINLNVSPEFLVNNK